MNKPMQKLRALNSADLLKEKAESYKELYHTKIQVATGQNANNHKISQLKKNIARIQFLMSEQRKTV